MLGANTYKMLALAGVAATALLAHTRPAQACGGCLHPPPDVASDPTVVSEHHMVFSVSQTQTVLWDQIKYSGNPKEFAWVLPVHPGTTIQLSHDEFIKALDAYTAPVVVPPQTPEQKGSALSCNGGCGSSDTAAAVDNASPGGGTTVVSDVVVGPYEAVTLHTSGGDSLNAWLASHQYDVPSSIQPIIDAYVKEQFDFIALRLLPGKGIQSMQPVRVVTQGADATLPLRMVAAGIGADVSVVLYVIGEGRYHTQNFHDVAIDDSQLTWDFSTSSSNYASLTTAAMTSGDSRGVLTEYAGHAFSKDFTPQYNYYYGGYSFSSLATAYQQAAQYAQSQGSQCTFGDGGVSGGPDAGSDAGGGDAGVGTGPCFYDDLNVATAGMVQSDVWVTRMKMDLPVGALGDDLRLAAASPQALVSNYHYVQPPSSDSSGCTTARGNEQVPWLVLGFGALFLRRRRRP